MACIVCFSDSVPLIGALRQALRDPAYELHVLPASRLDDDLRHLVRRLCPDLILLELTPTLDNPHLLFFLRSDCATRATPLVLLSCGTWAEQSAAILGADGALRYPFDADQLWETLDEHLKLHEVLVAA